MYFIVFMFFAFVNTFKGMYWGEQQQQGEEKQYQPQHYNVNRKSLSELNYERLEILEKQMGDLEEQIRKEKGNTVCNCVYNIYNCVYNFCEGYRNCISNCMYSVYNCINNFCKCYYNCVTVCTYNFFGYVYDRLKKTFL